MKNFIALVLLSLTLTGCSIFSIHKVDIDQGNIITQANTRRLHTGMSEAQVKNIMGNPVLINVFSPHRLDYVYTIQKANERMQEKRLTLIFKRGRLNKIQQD